MPYQAYLRTWVRFPPPPPFLNTSVKFFFLLPGGRLIYLSPGITVAVQSSWKIYSFIQVPLYQQVNELQLTPKWNFSIGINRSL